MKNFGKKILLSLLLGGLLLCPNFPANADNLEVDGLAIAKKLTTGEVEHTNRRIKLLGSNPGHFWEDYHKAHADLSFRERVFGGILEIDDLLNYMVFIVKFLSQLGMLIGVIFIMYAGYKYMLTVFGQGKDANSTLKNAIIGVIIIIFSYAIMKILTSIIGLT